MSTTQQDLFPVLSEEKRRALMPYGVERALAAGETLFREGEPARHFYVILDGELKVTRRVADAEMVLAVHEPGGFSGEISILAGDPAIATGIATVPSRVLEIDLDGLRRILLNCSWLAETILRAMVRRRPEADLLTQQREKLASLGMMAAGLAHELNNPASAAQRASQQLQESFQKQHKLSLALCARALTPEQREALDSFQQSAYQLSIQPQTLDPLTRSDREEALTQWLEDHQVADAWDLAPAFVEAGLEQDRFEALAAQLPPQALCEALHWLESTLSVSGLVTEIDLSMARISKLVQAVKAYSYMDQAPQQDIDIHEGLENTLTILGHKLRKGNIQVHKEYDRTIPRLTVYGSELSQVWTNLLINAIQALQGEGQIWIRTRCESDMALVEIADDGPGIPPEIQARIFEPFFTTKGVGEGTGMGLYISYSIIVNRHKGDLRVLSHPGDTRFQVRLPLPP